MESFPSSNTQLAAALSHSAQYITDKLGSAQISMVLGSGLGNFWKKLENCISIPYSDIPHMSAPDVPGHSGRLYFGQVAGLSLYCWGGRLHLYEGYESYQTALITHISAKLGCHTMLLTNGAGGGMRGMTPGCTMIIRDHINFEGFNTMDSYYHSLYEQDNFHCAEVYSDELSALAKEIGEREQFLPVFEGTYFCCSGPTFETPYETTSYIKLGGGSFGMSTIPEAMAAKTYGMRVLGMSLVTNLATCLLEQELSHEYVLAQSNQAASGIEQLFTKILEKISTLPPPTIRHDAAIITPTPLSSHKLQNRHRTVHLTPSDLHTALRWVQQVNQGCTAPTIAVCINFMQVSGLTNTRETLLTDLPSFPAFSKAGKQGKLTIGSVNGTRIVILSSPSEDGFDPFESLYLAKLVKDLGATHLHYHFSPCHPGVSQSTYLLDYYSMTTQCQPSPHFTSQHPARMSALGDVNVVAWAGPSLPSAAEIELGRRIGGHYTTIADMSILNAAGQVGLAHSGSMDTKGNSVNLREILLKIAQIEPNYEGIGEIVVTKSCGMPIPVKVIKN